MQRTTVAIAIASLVFAGAAPAWAGSPPASAPTQAEIDQQAMQQGPSTGRIGYVTHKDPAVAARPRAPVDPKLLRPLNMREAGMLFNACIAYAECATAYSKAYEHYQALQRAEKEKQNAGG